MKSSSSSFDTSRRKFIRAAGMSTAALALSGNTLADVLAEQSRMANARMGIVVHSYAFRWNSKTPSNKFPGFQSALDLLQHTHDIGGAGIQVVVNGWAPDFSKKVRALREKLGLYLEGSISVPYKQDEVAGFEQTVIQAKEAGATVLRTVTSTGRRYEAYHSAAEVEDFKKKALDALRLAEPILKKHQVKLAVENHKDWQAPELVAALKQLSSEWIGVTLDFGNSIALLEEPMSVVEQLAPFVLSTHVKDMGVEEYTDGFLLSEVPLGKGFLDLTRIYQTCIKYNPKVRFNLEMITRDPLQIPCLTPDYWSVFPDAKASDLASSMHLIRQRKSTDLPRVSHLDFEGKLATEENNILECLAYSKATLDK